MNSLQNTNASDTAEEPHFAFGKNWARFLASLDERRIVEAERSLQVLVQADQLQQKKFLDAGSGSGLFSLSAHRLGAEVTSFDVDADSVNCARSLKQRYGNHRTEWRIMQGSLTDDGFLKELGEFDIVYCWGVAHHTGKMWLSIDNLSRRVRPDGLFVLAIYNDQSYVSRIWSKVKQIYQHLPRFAGPMYVAAIYAGMILKRLSVTLPASIVRLVTFRNPLIPFINWALETQSRGMHTWHDVVDWVGGWPFEVAKPEEVFRFLRDRHFSLQELTTCSGHGCNEFVFRRS